MSATDSGWSERELKRTIVDELQDRRTSLSYRELADEIDVPERDVREVLSDLVDRGNVELTPDWEYEVE